MALDPHDPSLDGRTREVNGWTQIYDSAQGKWVSENYVQDPSTGLTTWQTTLQSGDISPELQTYLDQRAQEKAEEQARWAETRERLGVSTLEEAEAWARANGGGAGGMLNTSLIRGTFGFNSGGDDLLDPNHVPTAYAPSFSPTHRSEVDSSGNYLTPQGAANYGEPHSGGSGGGSGGEDQPATETGKHPAQEGGKQPAEESGKHPAPPQEGGKAPAQQPQQPQQPELPPWMLEPPPWWNQEPPEQQPQQIPGIPTPPPMLTPQYAMYGNNRPYGFGGTPMIYGRNGQITPGQYANGGQVMRYARGGPMGNSNQYAPEPDYAGGSNSFNESMGQLTPGQMGQMESNPVQMPSGAEFPDPYQDYINSGGGWLTSQQWEPNYEHFPTLQPTLQPKYFPTQPPQSPMQNQRMMDLSRKQNNPFMSGLQSGEYSGPAGKGGYKNPYAQDFQSGYGGPAGKGGYKNPYAQMLDQQRKLPVPVPPLPGYAGPVGPEKAIDITDPNQNRLYKPAPDYGKDMPMGEVMPEVSFYDY